MFVPSSLKYSLKYKPACCWSFKEIQMKTYDFSVTPPESVRVCQCLNGNG